MVLVTDKTYGTTVKSMAIVAFVSAANVPVGTVDDLNRTALHFV